MLQRKRTVGFLSLMLSAALVLSACATKSGGDRTDGGKNDGKPAVGGEIVFDVPDDPDTFAPFWLSSAYAAEVTDRVYGDGLLRIGMNMKPEPALAEALPTVSADQKTYTFKVRQGVKFHDGKPVTAKDIEFAYHILMDKDYDGPDKSTVAELDSVKALDDTTIEFKTKEIFAPFMFTAASVAPLPSHLLKDVPVKDMATWDGWKKPVGAGPWKFVEWKSGQYTLLERNADYWENGKPGVNSGIIGPYVDKIRMRVIPEEQTAMAALENGELSFRSSVEPQHVDRLKTDLKDKLVAYDWNRMGYGYQQFNTENFPTNIKEVRQALSYGLNREAILKGVMDNKATIPAGPIPPIHWAFDKATKGYTFDQAKAKQLIEKAGFKLNGKTGIYEKDGKPLKIKYVGTKGSSIVEGIALESQKDWKAIGVDVELVMVDFNTVLDKHLKPGDFNVTFLGMGFTVDPHASFDSNYHSRNIRIDAKGVNNGSNRSRYKNPQVDALIDKGKTTVDINERLRIYQDLQKIIIDDAPSNWIYVNVWTDFAKKDIKGVVNWDGYGINTSHMNQWYVTTK